MEIWGTVVGNDRWDSWKILHESSKIPRRLINRTAERELRKDSLYVCLPACLSINQSINQLTYLPTCLSTCISTSTCLCLSSYLSVYLSTYLSIYPSVCLSTRLPTYLPTYLHTYLPTHPSIYLFCLCLYIYTIIHLFTHRYKMFLLSLCHTAELVQYIQGLNTPQCLQYVRQPVCRFVVEFLSAIRFLFPRLFQLQE